MNPKIVRRQSTMLSRKNEKTARPTVPITGTDILRQVVMPRAMEIADMITIRTARITMTSRNSASSSSSLGNRTMIAAPSRDPMRDLRPPMITASRNRMLSSMT